MRRWLILFVACAATLSYAYAYFVRNAWPPHPWGGLGMVLIGSSVFLSPMPDASLATTRHRNAFLIILGGMVLWLIDGVTMLPRTGVHADSASPPLQDVRP